jgi:hypothetical protein
VIEGAAQATPLASVRRLIVVDRGVSVAGQRSLIDGLYFAIGRGDGEDSTRLATAVPGKSKLDEEGAPGRWSGGASRWGQYRSS